MRELVAFLSILGCCAPALAQKTVSFPTQDGGVVFADVYGSGERGLVLAHGGQFTRKSWEPQAQQFAAAGYRVLAFDFRGFGQSHGPGEKDFGHAPFQLDVLAAVRYLHTAGAKTVSIVGGSFGGGEAGAASIDSQPGEIDRIVILGAAPYGPAEKLKSASLWIVARDDASGGGTELRLPGIQAQYEKAPEPKKLIVLEGSAHAQYLFQADPAHPGQGERVMGLILDFLNGKAHE